MKFFMAHEINASDLFDDSIFRGDVLTNASSSSLKCSLSNEIILVRVLQMLKAVIAHKIVLRSRQS